MISVWVTEVHSLKFKWVFLSFAADQVFDTGDHEPVSIASTSMIEHIAIPAINQTFDAIGKTPLDPKRVKLKSYGEWKLRQLQADVRETLQMNKPKDDFEEILSQLKVKFKDATRSEKSKSWLFCLKAGAFDKSNKNSRWHTGWLKQLRICRWREE